MKTVKVSDEVHAGLKELSESTDESINSCIEVMLGKAPKDNGVDKVLDQIAMLHTRFDALEDSLSSLSFSEPKEDTYLSPAEARQKEIERLRVMDEFQQNAINHPEDEVQ